MRQKTFTLRQIADHCQAELFDPQGRGSSLLVHAVAPLARAGEGELTFLTNPQFKGQCYETKAAAIVLKAKLPDLGTPQLIHANPQVAMAKAGQLFYDISHPCEGQSPLAHVDETAELDPACRLFPFAYIGARTKIEKNAVIYPHCFVGDDCEIGEDTILYPGVVLMNRTRIGKRVLIHGGTVLGADGFGFAPDAAGLHKIPQTGQVVIEDDVEIGALVTIDRATYDQTIVRTGAKLDSHVHVGHNVDIGEMTMLCGQVGIAGSAKLGKRCIAAGQAGIGPGVVLGDGVILGAKAGAFQNEDKPGEYLGMPAIPTFKWKKQTVATLRLPDLMQTVKDLEKRLAALEGKSI